MPPMHAPMHSCPLLFRPHSVQRVHLQSTAAAVTPERENDLAIVERAGLLGSGDEEDVQFLEALKGLVDGAVKLLGADKGVGTRLMSGLLRKSGVVDVRLIYICVRCALWKRQQCTGI